MTEHRHVRLFRNGRNLAVRIPVEFELPGSEAIMHRDGERLVIEPVRKRGLVAKTMKSFEPWHPRDRRPIGQAGEGVLTRYMLDTNMLPMLRSTAHTEELKRIRGLKVENWLAWGATGR